ncbi:hypothetical protein LSUB1_G003739 [Lachnellula subtilissima]|uniref:Apple domain-containing protein n=1 Tax=Lachnellula subtilissima TaxID=602034 RepID=A0A8H8RVG9_9HELO|nr:hypothetical protein LSUB1_G003739 [Lachnellula subtilissima]
MRPLRKSSEGPEVVQPDYPDKYAISEKLGNARIARWTQSQKQVDPYRVETRHFPSPMPKLPSNIVPDRVERIGTKRKTFGLITTVILVIIAFLIGGGIGGGVGGAMVAKEKSKDRPTTSTTTIMPTATIISPGSTTTMIQDAAFCPLVHKSLYNSTIPGKKFLQVCDTNYLPADGQMIDIKNQTKSGLQPCLDFCAQTDGCIAASWVMFSAASPLENSVCFLKNNYGVQTSADGIGQVASGYLQP